MTDRASYIVYRRYRGEAAYVHDGAQVIKVLTADASCTHCGSYDTRLKSRRS